MPYTSTTPRPSTPLHTDGSRTITITPDPTREDIDDVIEQESDIPLVGALRLRGVRRNAGPRVAWDEGVVDNEGMGKKKSKICCIYHKPRRFDESSSDESSSESDSDSSCGGNSANHNHRHQHYHRRPPRPDGDVKDESSNSDSKPNAYERQPQRNRKGKRRAGMSKRDPD